MVKYLEDTYEMIEKPVARRGGILQLLPGQDEFGYGGKITTDRVVRVDKREYRVYCTQYSNAGSFWIVKGGQKLFLR